MRVYCVTKNSGPSWQSDPLFLVYLGTSVQEAEESVGDFGRYEKDEDRWPRDPSIYCILPKEIEREMVKYYMADGWWYSIVMFELVG